MVRSGRLGPLALVTGPDLRFTGTMSVGPLGTSACVGPSPKISLSAAMKTQAKTWLVCNDKGGIKVIQMHA